MHTLTTISLRSALLVIAILLAACSQAGSDLHGSPYPSPSTAPELALTDTQGVTFDLATIEGHAVLVYFGYTQCPDECPLTLANVRWAIEQLGAHGARVDFVLVTVDPDNDSPGVLRAYLDRFNARFFGLTGSDEQLAQARAGYGVLAATPESEPEHTDVLHGTRLYLIRPDGRLVTSYDMSVPKEDILADLRVMLETAG